MDLLVRTEQAAMRAGTAGAAPGPIAAMAFADIIRTLTSGSRSAAVRASSAGRASAPRARSSIAARPRVTGSGSESARPSSTTLPDGRRGSRTAAAAAHAAAPVFASTMLSTPRL